MIITEKITAWVFNILKRNWVTSLLLSAMISTIIFSLQSANWVSDDEALSTAFLTGILFGWLLSRSRFTWWLALPYSILISFIIAVEAAARVLPGWMALFTHSPGGVFEQMNLRIVNFSLRVAQWLETLRAGENVEDPGLFVVLTAAVLALCAVWLMWRIMRSRSALSGVLPIGLLYAINVHLSRQPLTGYMIFLFCLLLLIVRTEYNRQHEEWQRRKVDYPEQLGLEWGGAAAAIVLAIVLLSRAAPFLGTPEGWRAISEWVSRANQETETTATRLFSGVNSPPTAPGEDTVYATQPNLGSIGEPIPQGDRAIMWVRTSDPPPPPAEMGMPQPDAPAYIHYWRGAVYGEYNGRGWLKIAAGGPPIVQSDAPVEPPAGRYFLRQDFSLVADHSTALFAASDPVAIGRGAALRRVNPGGGMLVESSTSNYQVISAATRVTANQLAGDSMDYAEEIRAVYLTLPEGIPPRVAALAGRVVGGEKDAYHKALKIQNYLRENYNYNLAVPRAPEDRDVVDYFLFDQPAGFCSHYASAMTVMLRSVGVPARVVTGYAMGEFTQERQAYRVPESGAHAWVEVFFPGYGWVEFEPTPARTAIVYTEEAQPVEEPGTVVELDENHAPQADPSFVALVIVGAALFLALPFFLLRIFSTGRQPLPVQVSVLYRRIRQALSWAGMRAASSVTPDEYLAMYTGRLGQYALLSQALHQATALYRESVYSPRPPDERRVRSASLLWRRSFRDWMVLWMRVKWQNLRARFGGDQQMPNG